MDGPIGETRARGILLPKQARYQLRYTRKYMDLSHDDSKHNTRMSLKKQEETV